MTVIAKKRFGQNFLTSDGVIARIIHAISPRPDDIMLEIGPGLGALTYPLLRCVQHLFAIEIDRDLSAQFNVDQQKLTMFTQDALCFDFSSLVVAQKIRVVGNLPYNISTPLLFHWLASMDRWQDAHFMLQKEVVDRIVAGPGTKTYGQLSVILQYYCDVERVFVVPPSAFSPKPKVQSAILRLLPKRDRLLPEELEGHFVGLVKQAFSQRRKTLNNTVGAWVGEYLDASRRAETLTVSEFVTLAKARKV